MIETMEIALLGFARENNAVLKFLKKSSQYRGVKITICDRNPNLATSQVANIDLRLGKTYLRNLSDFDIVFRTPGLPYLSPEIQSAKKNGVIISSQTKLFFEEAKKIGCMVVGVTGTKGKGTTSTLLYKMLKAAGKPAFLAGNIGTPTLDLLPRLRKNSIVILELSSFQLQDLNQSPSLAVVLEIFPDHMDAHKNFKEYIDAKANIARWQKRGNKVFYFTHDKYSTWIARHSKGKKVSVDQLFYNSQELENDIAQIIKIPGKHNLKNARMATTVALSLGCSGGIILKTIKNFHGNEHRLELTRVIRAYQHRDPRESAFIKFYNDSASTNPQTTAAAIQAFKEPKILIAGGKDKNLNYSPVAKALRNYNTKLIILFGENKKKIKKQIASCKVKIIFEKDLKSALDLAYQKAKSLVAIRYSLNPIVLFSPGSTSFDMFKDYKDRGDQFKKLVRKLK
ncbi:UDP-N-acetylmuramoyl-L-alanine--D-glutamate ligase [Candidatus Wolfebacteria bacterium]|nr:UDP-N-acetylmuramoyl-L-alanine--D-glutamate ligase [Candidatus Wolfebacteria bacterium]